MAEFPTYEQMAKNVAEKALDEFLYDGKSIREWIKIIVEQEPKWIPVSERLPEDKTYVLTTIKVPNRIAHARSSWYECGFFHNDNGDTWRATDMEVKAWMPLPEPYDPQESEDKEWIKAIPSAEPNMTWVTGADGAKIAFKDVPVWKVTKICEILGESQESEE